MELPFEKLDVWREAMELAKQIYRVTHAFPLEEQFGLRTQMRRAAVSIPANIAEGKGRHYDKSYVQFLYTARGSLYELVTLMKLSVNLRYLSPESAHEPMLLSQAVLRKLSGLINSMT